MWPHSGPAWKNLWGPGPLQLRSGGGRGGGEEDGSLNLQVTTTLRVTSGNHPCIRQGEP